MMKNVLISALLAWLPQVLPAQGINTASSPFNVYLNFSGAAVAGLDTEDGTGGFRCKQLRLEVKGNLTDHFYYRLRQRLNKSSAADNEDGFSSATDYMMVGYRFSDLWTVEAGKMFPYWGGFEYDTNPMYIYQYSDMVGLHDMPKAGFAAIYSPVPSQQFVVEVCNARNQRLETTFPGITAQGFTDARAPLTYILNWNGSFAQQLLQTRWSFGVRTLASNAYSRQLTLGQRLNLQHFQCYVDYTYESDDIDRMGIVTREAAHLLPVGQSYFEHVVHHSLVAKADWQFAPQWNAYVQGMYETASVRKSVAALHDYRRHYSYFAGVEYYPVKSQDLRVSLSFLGQSFHYSARSGIRHRYEDTGISDPLSEMTRIELGMMYRIKCF